MNPPIWMFLTVLIVVCLVIAVGILALALVALLNPSTVTGTTGSTGLQILPFTQALPFSPSLPVPQALPSPSLPFPQPFATQTNQIQKIYWDPEQGFLRVDYKTEAKAVRFVIRSSEHGQRWPIWTSDIYSSATIMSAHIRNRNLILFQRKHDEYFLEMEDAVSYQLLTSDIFHSR